VDDRIIQRRSWMLIAAIALALIATLYYVLLPFLIPLD
jgi:hypothetical protein